MKQLLQRLRHRYTVFFFDSLMVVFAWLGAYWLRFNLSIIPPNFWSSAVSVLPLVLLIQMTLYGLFGLYRGDWRYASIPDLIRIIKAVAMGSLFILLALFVAIRNEGIPRSVIPLYALLLVTALGGARFLYRRLREFSSYTGEGIRVFIIGAGKTGESLARDLMRDPQGKYIPVAFVDDNRYKQKSEVRGLPVIGTCDTLPENVKKMQIGLVIVAIPSMSSEKLRRIVSLCEATGVPFRTVPGIDDLTAGRVSVSALRDISIENLLGREPVKLDWDKIANCVHNRVVLITGGGGSIGSEICRQVAAQKPKQLLVLENNEFNLYSIQMELQEKYPDLNFVPLLIDVADEAAVFYQMELYKPQVVFHAAAYKHVPILEYQVRSAIRNNLFGTQVIADASAHFGVNEFILISTDKVVNPENVLGATKRIAEMYCQNLNARSNTRFITVRFGNVLGSTGSVVPRFKKQLENGGPVTVTHPQATRYFMMIPEAVQLILQATVLGQGGEIFILDMGEPVNISELATLMIKLAGKKVGEDIQIVYTGLRPGEKLHEQLYNKDEVVLKTEHAKIMQVQSKVVLGTVLQEIMTGMQKAGSDHDEMQMLALLNQLIPEYQQSKLHSKPELKVVS